MATQLLVDQRCLSHDETTLLSDSEIKKYVEELHCPWKVENNKLSHEFTFNNFDEAMYFVNEVAAVAEGEGHHPDIHVFYKKVILELWTHAVNGLSLNDFILASKIETCE